MRRDLRLLDKGVWQEGCRRARLCWLLLVVLLLVACGGESEPPATATLAAQPTATQPVATSALPASPTPLPDEPTPTPTVPPGPASLTPAPLPERSPSVVTPALRAAASVRPSSPCIGDGLFADDGIVYSLGRREGETCASAIDLDSGAVQAVEPSALSFPPEAGLQVSDLARGRVYVAAGDVVSAYDEAGQELGPLFSLPPGEIEGFTSINALRLFAPPDDEVAGRLYLSYYDFDSQQWLAMSDLSSGESVSDVPVPYGPWALTGDGRLVFADAATLLVLDGATLDIVQRLSFSGRPSSAVLDPQGERLFVADEGGDLRVHDPLTLVERQRLPGLGSGVSLDPKLNQLYVGDRYSGGVSVLDLDTLEPLGRIPQPGRPVASPADGLLYILEEDVYQADGATLQLITQRTLRKPACNGCSFPNGVVVDPNSGLTHVSEYHVWVGKPGRTDQVVVDPWTGRAFVALTTGGYQPLNSLAVYPDLSLGEPTRWIDGLYGQPLYNPVSGQLYLADGNRLLLLDGQSLELLGSAFFPENLDLLTVDQESGTLYAAQGEQLLRLPAGEIPLDAPQRPSVPMGEPEPVGALPGPVYAIVVSPAFAQDDTLFARATDWESGRIGLYRSRDAGSSWERIAGGLPGAPNELIFAPDGRLYAALVPAGWRIAPELASWGEGVYVSEDGGDTWRPDNRGLTHLRVGRLHAAGDGTLYALAATAIEPGDAASALTIWSRPPGQDWALLPVLEAGPLREDDYAVPEGYTQAIRAYWRDLSAEGPQYQGWGEELRRSDDGGQTWRTVGSSPSDYANVIVNGSEGLYWLGQEGLWYTRDEGITWAALRHPDLLDVELYALTVSAVGGAETLFLGLATGQVLVVPVDGADWEGLAPAPTAAPLACDLPPAEALAAVWDELAWQARLGCPTQAGQAHPLAYQPFEGGVMIWDGAPFGQAHGAEAASIYVAVNGGEWFGRPDNFHEGDSESDPALTPPQGLYQPRRGFGLLWRSEDGLRQALGWALTSEVGLDGTAQPFEGGYAIAGSDGRLWLFYFDGAPRWEALIF